MEAQELHDIRLAQAQNCETRVNSLLEKEGIENILKVCRFATIYTWYMHLTCRCSLLSACLPKYLFFGVYPEQRYAQLTRLQVVMSYRFSHP